MYFLLHILPQLVLASHVYSAALGNQTGTSLDINDTGADTAELLHVGADTKVPEISPRNRLEEPRMDAEGPDISTGLARNPKDTEVTAIVDLDELGLLNGVDTSTELALAFHLKHAVTEPDGRAIHSKRSIPLSVSELGALVSRVSMEGNEVLGVISGAP
ncbi:hypothetical protein QR685DRAFT_548070 [Neurospora intermedia]|uniref:Uncharacterized protein n=1 Tax=Neurospora intermedia TaxID=5142 RepID=A0ABR3CZZ6_NEUIN